MTDFERLLLMLGCKATLILGLAAGASVLIGRRWPQHCLLWQRVGVVALLALPLAAWALPSVGIPVLSARPMASTGELEQGQLGSHAIPMDNSDEPHQPNDLASVPGARTPERPRQGMPSTNIGSILGLSLAAAYGVIVAILLLRLFRAWHGLSQLKGASTPVVDPSWQSTLKHWSTKLRIVRPVELRMSDAISIPMTFYWRAPVVLIPSDCLGACNQTEREAIVVHELSHIAHGDFWWQTMTRVVAALYWIHPLMWLIRRQDNALCERICDLLCSQHLSREPYAVALVRIAGRNILRPAAVLSIPMAHASSLGRRLTDLQSDSRARISRLTRTQRVLLAGTAGLILGLVVLGTLTTTTRASAEGDRNEQPVKQNPDGKASHSDSIHLPATLDGQVFDQKDKPVANANVTVKILRCDANGLPTGASAPDSWSAKTDNQGRYRFETGAASVSLNDVLSIKVRAEGFPEMSISYFAPAASQGTLPLVRLYAGRTVSGRIVDPQGKPVTKAVVRFQASSPDFIMWDSGPLPVDERGTFSVSIPKDAKAAVSIYPSDFAPQIVTIPENETDLGDFRVENGTSLTGRVVDREGRGIAGTVVAIQGEVRSFLLLGIRLGSAVKTDENGRFRLPPVRGTYRVFVSDNAPDYSRQLSLRGVAPPPILPQNVHFDGKEPTRGIILHEAESVTIRGTVRGPNGSGVPDVQIRADMMPPGWSGSSELAATRTNSQGVYELRLPAPADGVRISAELPNQSPEGAQVTPKGRSVDNGHFAYERLTSDRYDADWVISTTKK